MALAPSAMSIAFALTRLSSPSIAAYNALSTITKRSQTPPTDFIHFKWEKLSIYNSEACVYAQSTRILFKGVKYHMS